MAWSLVSHSQSAIIAITAIDGTRGAERMSLRSMSVKAVFDSYEQERLPVWRYLALVRASPGADHYDVHTTVSVLVADDFAEWRAYTRNLLQSGQAYRVIGEATNGLEAVQKSIELRPDIVLLDVRMPILNGIEAAERIRQASPASRIIFVTQTDDRDTRTAALSAGAEEYLLKAKVFTDLLPTIDEVLRNRHGPQPVRPIE